MIDVYLGLGSNLQNPIEQIKIAIRQLKLIKDSNLIQSSSLYLSKPMGGADQSDYINAVVLLQSKLSPTELFAATSSIENQQGRVRSTQKWASRIIDIDIILYGDEKINTKELQIPHYDISAREFVLYPLYEIEPELYIPDLGAIKELVSRCDKKGLKQLGNNEFDTQ